MSARGRRRWHVPIRWGALVIALLVGIAGCGLSPNDEPQAIDADDVPADLLDPNPPTSTTISDDAMATATVYLIVREGDTTRLAPVERVVTDPTRPGPRINALLAPTSAEEQQEGLSSSIPADTVLIDTELRENDRELVVNLSGALFDIQGEELAIAFAQLVWTVTELDGVRQVSFEVDGEAYRAPDDEGIEQPGAVTRADYSSVAPG